MGLERFLENSLNVKKVFSYAGYISKTRLPKTPLSVLLYTAFVHVSPSLQLTGVSDLSLPLPNPPFMLWFERSFGAFEDPGTSFLYFKDCS